MNKNELKNNLHKQIDDLQSEEALQLLHDAAVDYNTGETDIIDELSVEQKALLDTSLWQVAEGKTLPHAEAMQLIQQWRSK